MKIRENLNGFTNEKTYQIIIGIDEDLEAWEIAECFKRQFPKVKAVISFSKIKSVEVGIIIIGVLK